MANPTMTTDQFLLSQHRRARTRGSFDSYAVLEAGQRLGSPLLCSSHATDIGESKPIYSCLALILLFNLPRELQVMVLSHLSFGDIERLRRTCRFTRQRIPKSLVYQLFPDMAVAFYSTCYVCLDHDASGNSIVAARKDHPRRPMANRCVRCVAQSNSFMVGRQYLLASRRIAWLCRWCGYPVVGESARNQPEFHVECWLRYERSSRLYAVVGVVQWLMAIACSGICLEMFKDEARISAPAALAIIGCWLPPLCALRGRMDRSSSPANRVVDLALVLVVLNMMMRAVNVAGNVILYLEYMWWRRRKPNNHWLEKLVHYLTFFLVLWTYPKSIEIEHPLWF
ncbi:uncharacterized protein UV8b_05262 [Ustilaginoidea virens]|uniref:F-box domain-containing protein n=1 Tax=Ustilaginoidea virens TaxID=1159556 RepID=A0A8E5MIR6_USTVR|nr:uncharacterized protein UV8b_05262 [Ustilaginoidea virens]QUC21021.1 hypothetical protein UV8b_05262 [Ustilaginoidea virens]